MLFTRSATLLGTALLAGLATAAVNAQGQHTMTPPAGQDMMHGGMMGGDMTGMMTMMQQMSQMMQSCSEMMQAAMRQQDERPKESESAPDQNG